LGITDHDMPLNIESLEHISMMCCNFCADNFIVCET